MSVMFPMRGNRAVMVGIYKITSPSGKVYIGQSWDIFQRWAIYQSPSQGRGQRHLYASFSKYGVGQHRFEIVIVCDKSIAQGELDRLEQFYMDSSRDAGLTLLNCKEAGSAGKHSEESKARMSASRKGRSRGPCKQETKEKISAALSGQPGRPLTDEAKEKIRIAKTGRPMREETKAKLSKYWMGRNLGRPNSPEAIEKMRAAKARNAHLYIGNTWGSLTRGQKHGPHSPERKRKIAEGQFIGRWLIYRNELLIGDFESSHEAGAALNIPASTLRSIKNRVSPTTRAGKYSELSVVIAQRQEAA